MSGRKICGKRVCAEWDFSWESLYTSWMRMRIWEEDLKKGCYNPLKKLCTQEGYEEKCREILCMMIRRVQCGI